MDDIDINEYFPVGDYLRVEDLQGRAIKLTMAAVIPKMVESQQYGNKRAIDITFTETDRIFTAFPKNARTIADGYGPRTGAWIGRQIVLKPGRTTNGKPTIDAEPVYEMQAGLGQPAQQAQPLPQNPEPPSVPGIDEPSYPAEPPGSLPGPDDYEDSIPF